MEHRYCSCIVSSTGVYSLCENKDAGSQNCPLESVTVAQSHLITLTRLHYYEIGVYMFLGPDHILSQGFLPPVIVSTSGKGKENALSFLIQLNALVFWFFGFFFLPFSFHWLYLKQPLPSPQAQQTKEPDQCLRGNPLTQTQPLFQVPFASR